MKSLCTRAARALNRAYHTRGKVFAYRYYVSQIRNAFTVPTNYAPLPVSAPATALLRSGWTWYGKIDPWERPGPLAHA